MSELWKYPSREKVFLTAFPAAYNHAHGAAYSGAPERPGKVEHGWDYRWPHPTLRRSWLEVQHTAAASNEDMERVHLPNASTVNSLVCKHLKTSGHRGHVVVIRAGETPRNRRHLRTAVDFVCCEIDRAIAVGIPVGRTARGAIPWRTRHQKSSFEVEVNNDGRDFQATSILSPTPNGFCEDPRWRLVGALRLKAEHIGYASTEVVLVVDFDMGGFDYEDVPAMNQVLSDEEVPFREAWAVDLGRNTKAVRVWPTII